MRIEFIPLTVAAVGASAQYLYAEPAENSTSSYSSAGSDDVSIVTEYYDDCSTNTGPEYSTVTGTITQTYCPECEMSKSASETVCDECEESAMSQIGYPSSAVITESCHECEEASSIVLTTYITVYDQFCSTGLEPKTYTVTEPCPYSSTGKTLPSTHVPSGFTVVTSACTVCKEPITTEITCPISQSSAPTIYSTASGATTPIASVVPTPAPAAFVSGSGPAPTGAVPSEAPKVVTESECPGGCEESTEAASGVESPAPAASGAAPGIESPAPVPAASGAAPGVGSPAPVPAASGVPSEAGSPAPVASEAAPRLGSPVPAPAPAAAGAASPAESLPGTNAPGAATPAQTPASGAAPSSAEAAATSAFTGAASPFAVRSSFGTGAIILAMLGLLA